MSDSRKNAAFGCILLTVKTHRQNAEFARLSRHVKQSGSTSESVHLIFAVS